MEYRDEVIEKMLENLTEVPVPAELSRRITERIDKTVRRRARTKVMRRSIGAVAAGVLLFSGSIMLLPSFAAYAKQIPGLEAAVRWLEGAGDFIGIRNAKEHGYIPAPQNGLNLNTPDASAIPLTGSQLADQYEDVPGRTFSPELGIIFDNVNRWEQSPEKPKEYDIAIMAPELDEYEISIRRHNAPVEMNQKIEFTIPPLAEEHERVGSLTEPKYSKTVNDLDGSLLERAKQSIREAAGRDIELYGVEEYKGTVFHDVIVYSKDHKSRVALDMANGTSDISLSMSYAELPADIKRIVESDTGLSGQQLADLVTEVARERGRHEREVHTSITGPDFRVEMIGSRITSMGYEIPIDQADPKALEAALVTLGKPVQIVQAGRSYAADMRGGSSSDVYRFKDEQQDFLVEIGYTSGRILSVYASGLLETGTNETEDMFSQFSDKQVFDAAAPDVKKLFGIDLAGYKVQRTTGTNYYTFTNEGSPAIEGEMNRHFKFYRFDISRNNGTIQ
ncbi:hypothetical protein [Paenibacillus dendritiformis]|uniref:hypothetical protein n=1 Tax=Paenibacillus dendritiformis TaxID=130049 RepID=UPI000DA79E0A|nr:hypothetical protein [Paenibacillus dendritiformis]PZM66040.1 hypothetical protein DOE73_08590 [Paenibacillus dendritiformis]